MKHHLRTTTLAVTVLTVAAVLAPPRTWAGDKEWATAGKILTGVVAAHVLLNGLPPARVPVPATVTVVREVRCPAPPLVRHEPRPLGRRPHRRPAGDDSRCCHRYRPGAASPVVPTIREARKRPPVQVTQPPRSTTHRSA